MSSSANGKVIYGYRLDSQLLRVADGKEKVCSSYPSHVILDGGNYCPQCSSRVTERDRMVPSPIVLEYAERSGVTPDGALDVLVQYQHQAPTHWNDTKQVWIFGVTVVDGWTNTCTEFETMASTSRVDEELAKAVRLFTVLRLDPIMAKYYLLVELSS